MAEIEIAENSNSKFILDIETVLNANIEMIGKTSYFEEHKITLLFELVTNLKVLLFIS